jgi:hypothetical protein
VDAEQAGEGKGNVLVQFQNFPGWDQHALRDNIRFSTTHCAKITRLALVGDKRWETWMASFCKPFTLSDGSLPPCSGNRSGQGVPRRGLTPRRRPLGWYVRPNNNMHAGALPVPQNLATPSWCSLLVEP